MGICQLLETTLLNLTNFPSLICTNAARMRLAAGDDKILLEFGLRRVRSIVVKEKKSKLTHDNLLRPKAPMVA